MTVGVALGQDVAHRALERPDELPADDLALALRVAAHPKAPRRKRSSASTVTRRAPVAATKSRCTWSRSPARSRPWSTNTQSAGRRWRAAPVPRPPRSPLRRTARRSPVPSPICSRTASIRDSAMLAGVQAAPMPAKSCRKRLSTCWPCGVCMHLGVVLHAGQPAGAVLERRDGRAGADRDDLEALRRGGDRVAVAHPHRLLAGQSRMQFAAKDFHLGAAVLAGAGAGDGAAEGLRHGLESVADAEHRDVQVEQRRVELRSAVGVHTGRPAGQHDRLRVLGLDLARPSRCAGRPRRTPAPRGPGARSAARTGHRSRSPGRDAGDSDVTGLV